jgi:hypothetical protein
MEFFSQVKSSISAEDLQARLTLASLPQWCASIYEIDAQDEQCGEMQCLWGVFRVCREIIKGGVRFSLPGCPNAFVWTVTTQLDPDPDVVVLHATINRQEHDPDFIESIETFIEDWRSGLQRGLTA